MFARGAAATVMLLPAPCFQDKRYVLFTMIIRYAALMPLLRRAMMLFSHARHAMLIIFFSRCRAPFAMFDVDYHERLMLIAARCVFSPPYDMRT